MNLPDIANIRMESQQLESPQYKTPEEIVRWMGAMQAQDYHMAKWAIGIRMPGSTDRVIEEALDKGNILRTHLLRPTWHFVAAEDIVWMLNLTAPRIKSILKSRHKELELTKQILQKSNTIIEKALIHEEQLSREDLMNEFTRAKIPTDHNRASHLLLWAELEGLICSGTRTAKKPTYALIDRRIPNALRLSREESLAKLAGRYFRSHCPATLHDFVWWSGLTLTDAKLALEMNKAIVPETIHESTYWFPDSFSYTPKSGNTAFLIPAYDEFIISYKNRNAVLAIENRQKYISSNGIFRPVLLVQGQVTGIWRKYVNKDMVVIEVSLSRNPGKGELSSINVACENLGLFLEKKVNLQLTY